MEAKLKSFTSSIMDCLIIPLNKRLEEWNKTTGNLDKEYGKEYKRARAELKKRTIETLRLQKKLRKGGLHNGSLSSSFHGTLPRSHGGSSMIQSALAHNGSDMSHQGLPQGGLNRTLESSMRDQTEKRQVLEEVGKLALRAALTEERSRFCLFVSYLKPVVDEEVAMLYELQHVQEAMAQLEKNAGDPFTLPAASEQVITDIKGETGAWSFQTPPSSPSSLGSRKSSMCSISSANSSSSSSAHSPSHNVHNRTLHHQPMSIPSGNTRFSSVSSQDSGFVSQDTLYSRMSTPLHDSLTKPCNQSEGSNTSSTASSNSSTPSSPYPPGQVPPTTNSTWPNLQETIQFERAASAIMNDRPHTISSGALPAETYEKGHQRPPLTVYTFQPPADPNSHSNSPVTPTVESQSQSTPGNKIYQAASEIYGILRGKTTDSKPPVPKRGSSLERPGGSNNSSTGTPSSIPKPPRKINSAKESGHSESNRHVPHVPDFNPASDDMIVPQPVYVNMHELNQMASAKLQRQSEELPPPPPELMTPQTKSEAANNGSMNNEPHYGRGLSDDSHSIAPSDVTLEGEVDMHDKYETASCVSSHVPLTTDDFRTELESMIGSMSSCSVSEQTLIGDEDADLESISGLSSVTSFGMYEDGGVNYRTMNGNCLNEHYRNDNGDWRNRADWCNKNVRMDPCGDIRNNNGGSRSNFLLHGRHHSMYVSNGSSFTPDHRGSYSSMTANIPGVFHEHDSAPPSLPVSVATIHRRLANPRMPIFDAQHAEKTEHPPETIVSSPHMGMHRNNSLPRPHSYAAPQSNFMKYRLSLARKRDLV
ncbi:Metastasis suppressor protein 1 [Orchesella cincta]|uniref:Metastasis suppressor protein 1 n=1 Tax=Orchesella cincta TaxID=48709 RepID=A0A1D2NJV9_ORCCI|nr:Metastasis suppressor protein 1 [Orchesella cincta]